MLDTRSRALVAVIAAGMLSACSGGAGPAGPTGASGIDGTNGADGINGTNGNDGTTGVACWDLNGDGVRDAAEDINGDGAWSTLDCHPQATGAAAETCSLCHGSDRIAAVPVMHGIEIPDYLEAEVTGVNATISATIGASDEVIVDATVLDQDGNPITGIGSSSFRFTLARLDPSTGGDSSKWMSLISQSETPSTNLGGDGSPETQATYQRGSDGAAFVDVGNGDYTFTFAAVTVTAADDAVTHRAAMQVDGQPPFVNPVVDFRRDSGTVDTRDIVTNAACNTCHEDLALHGQRRGVEYCVICHNPGSVDAETDNTVDMKVMIHRIHLGRDLPSVSAGGQYAIVGYRESVHDYSEVGFPQPATNCTKCHVAGPADADNWMNVPTREACGSCHDDIDFDTGVGHVTAGAQPDNTLCAGCHPATGTVYAVTDSHEDRAAAMAGEYIAAIEDLAFESGTRVLDITFSIKDSGGTAYNLFAAPEFVQLVSRVTRLAIVVGWDTADYTNIGAGNHGGPISIDPLNSASPATDNSDGTYTTSVTLPAEAYGTGVVAIEGHPAGDDGAGAYTLRVPMTNVFQYFNITSTSPRARRTRVDIAKCDNCHGTLSVHGANRNDAIEVCVICHNPNATDLTWRPDDHVAAAVADGKKEASIDFKHMIHAIHGAHKRESAYVAFGYGGTEHVFGPEEVTFPGILSRCTACHLDDEYQLPLSADVLGSTVDTDPSAATKADSSAAALADPADDANISPAAAVCSGCHDTTLAATHMEQNGASFGVLQSEIVNLE